MPHVSVLDKTAATTATAINRRISSRLSIAIVALFQACAAYISAATFNIPDGDFPALVSALNLANTNNEDDTIYLAQGGTYYITRLEPYGNITDGLPIQSDGGHRVTVMGQGATLICGASADSFNIRQFIVSSGAFLCLNDAVLTAGPADPQTGGILNHFGTLMARNCKFIRNVIGINNQHGTVTVDNCDFTGNKEGGAIANDARDRLGTEVGGSATLIVNNTRFTDNIQSYGRYPGHGGGISNQSGSNGGANLTVTHCIFTNNQALGAAFGGISSQGGAIYSSLNANGSVSIANTVFSGNNPSTFYNSHYGNGTPVTVSDCTFTGNMGRGIVDDGGLEGIRLLVVQNCTFSENGPPLSGDQPAYWGGAVLVQKNGSCMIINCTLAGNNGHQGAGVCGFADGGRNPSLQVINCTFSGNKADQGGGAIASIIGQGGDVVNISVGNSIFQTGASGENIYNSSNFISLGHNVSNDAAGGDGSTGPGGLLNAAGDKRNTDPKLDPAGLNNNGGPTETIALQPDSPAIDAGDDAYAPPRDQRHYLRSGVSDVGAFEFGGRLAPVAAVSRKTHGMAGIFDIDLPIIGKVRGVECRSGGANGEHQVVISFATPVNLTGLNVTGGNAFIRSYSIDNSDVTLNLSGVANAQKIVMTLYGINDGVNTNDGNVSMGVLLGDTTGNGMVNSSDLAQTKSKSGQAMDATTFRSDVTVNGSINSSDVSLVKSKSGTALP